MGTNDLVGCSRGISFLVAPPFPFSSPGAILSCPSQPRGMGSSQSSGLMTSAVPAFNLRSPVHLGAGSRPPALPGCCSPLRSPETVRASSRRSVPPEGGELTPPQRPWAVLPAHWCLALSLSFSVDEDLLLCSPVQDTSPHLIFPPDSFLEPFSFLRTWLWEQC